LKLYKMIVNETQLKCIKKSLESYFKLGIGQLENVLFDLGFNQCNQFSGKMKELHSAEVEDAIKTIKHKIFDMSFNSSYGIHNSKLNEDFKICWEIFEVIRNRLAWDTNIKGGMEVDFDTPTQITNHGLITIELYEGEDAEKTT